MSNNSLVKDLEKIIDNLISKNNTQVKQTDSDNSELGDIDHSKIQRTLEELDLLEVHFSEMEKSVFQFLEMARTSNNPHPQAKDLEILSDLVKAFKAKANKVFPDAENIITSLTMANETQLQKIDEYKTKITRSKSERNERVKKLKKARKLAIKSRDSAKRAIKSLEMANYKSD